MRKHITFFGLRNAGKSSLINAFTAQLVSVVSNVPGTTTDPVRKTMELLPAGPVLVTDTPGVDDEGTLGEMRVKRTMRMLDETDFAVLAVDAEKGIGKGEEFLLSLFAEKKLPYLIVYTKADLLKEIPSKNSWKENEIYVSAKEKINIRELRERIGTMLQAKKEKQILPENLVKPGDFVVMVIPIDSSAPKDRLILPQQLTIREILDKGANAVCIRENQITQTLETLGIRPKLVITDSQVFQKVKEVVPENIFLTSFSILFAAYKGDLWENAKNAGVLDELKENDRILISEGCTHHRQCEDIGTVKLPAWLQNYTGKSLQFTFTSGGEFPEDLEQYACIVHCGGCMLNEKEVRARYEKARKQNVRMTNYGIAIAKMNGILERSMEPFKGEKKE